MSMRGYGLVASATPFANRALGRADNARFAGNILRTLVAPSGLVIYDDGLQGAPEPYDLRRLLADPRLHGSVAALLALWLAWIVGSTRLRGPPLPVSPPGVAAAVANLGCLLADKVPVNLNFSLGREQALSCLQRAEVELVVTAGAFRNKLAEKFPDFPWGDRVLDVADFLTTCPRAGLAWRIALIRVLPAAWTSACLGLPKRGGETEAA